VNTQNARAATGAPCTIGQIILSASQGGTNGIPANGQLLPISQYQALFVLLGTTYGGNGETDFALPNLGKLAPNGTTYSICANGVFPSLPS
jgi:microcystin-dependent protein